MEFGGIFEKFSFAVNKIVCMEIVMFILGDGNVV